MRVPADGEEVAWSSGRRSVPLARADHSAGVHPNAMELATDRDRLKPLRADPVRHSFLMRGTRGAHELRVLVRATLIRGESVLDACHEPPSERLQGAATRGESE